MPVSGRHFKSFGVRFARPVSHPLWRYRAQIARKFPICQHEFVTAVTKMHEAAMGARCV